MVKQRTIWLVPLGLSLVLLFLIQFSQANIIGADGHLHGRLAIIISGHGFLKNLSQAHFSWFVSRFADKDFVYHLYLVPFVIAAGYENGTKLGALVSTSALFACVFLVLRVYGKSGWMAWCGLFLFCSAQFLRDTAEARPLVLAIFLTIVGIHCLVRQVYRPVFYVAFFYGLVHMSAWIIPIVAGVFALTEWMLEGKLNLKLFWFSLAGWAASFLIHPNFPQNLFYFYLNGMLVPLYALKTGILELGAEFFPLYTSEMLANFPFLPAGMVVFMFLKSFSGKKLSREVMLWGVAVFILLPMAFVAKRNMTHVYPVSIIFFSLAISETLTDIRTSGLALFNRVMMIVGTLTVCLFLYGTWTTTALVSRSLFSERVYAEHFLGVSRVMHNQVPPGVRIFHTNWSDSQYLIGLAPQYEYIVTLDPIYMYTYNQELYERYRAISFGQSASPVDEITGEFQSNYVYAGKNYFNGLITQLRQSPRAEIVGEDDLGVLFRLKSG